MKRKDAISKVKAILDNTDGVCTNRVRADAILFELEKLGMLPPKVSKFRKFFESEYSELANEWEDV